MGEKSTSGENNYTDRESTLAEEEQSKNYYLNKIINQQFEIQLLEYYQNQNRNPHI